MQITHPSAYYNGQPPENVFLVTDDAGSQISSGYVVYQYLPHLYPDRPVNVYFTSEGQREGQYMLFGALIARARQLRDANPNEQARVYTCLRPDDREAIDFYTQSGLNCSEREVFVQLALPEGEVHVPMACSTEETPLFLPNQQMAFLDRLQRNDVTHIDATFLMQLMRTQHFHAVGLFTQGQLAGEILVAGSGYQAEILALYISLPFRRSGLATALARRALWNLTQEGVRYAAARFVTRSVPQKALMKTLGTGDEQTTAVFPQLFM